ncbi:MAG: hydrogenase-4 component G [Campylobacterota bacterium]
MKIPNSITSMNLSMKQAQFQTYQKDEKTGAQSLMNVSYTEFSFEIKGNFEKNSLAQLDIFDLANKMSNLKSNLSSEDLQSIGYSGKPIKDLSQDEAASLVSEDGFFGIAQTSNRVADFVLSGAGDDIEKLRAGREGILQGFKEAEQIWGEKLPDISYDTLSKTLEKIDQKIEGLGYNVLDTTS